MYTIFLLNKFFYTLFFFALAIFRFFFAIGKMKIRNAKKNLFLFIYLQTLKKMFFFSFYVTTWYNILDFRTSN